MTGGQKADANITQQVTTRLANKGIRSPCRVLVQTKNGEVTMSGTVQYAHQKQTAVGLVNGLPGVKRVVDRMTVKATMRS